MKKSMLHVFRNTPFGRETLLQSIYFCKKTETILIENAAFPVLIPTPVYKKWNNITVFFGGSKNAINALRLGMQIMEVSGCSLRLFTHAKKKPQKHYRQILEENNLFNKISEGKIEWFFLKPANFGKIFILFLMTALWLLGHTDTA